MLILAIVACVLAALPAGLFLANLRLYLPPPLATGLAHDWQKRPVSVLIPARNEQAVIVQAVQAALHHHHPLEVVVLDDHSEDDTARLVKELHQQDERVRLEHASPLPSGWCGKQHACAQLAQLARYEFLLFLDADVRLEPEALRRIGAQYAQHQADLLSGFPRQVTGTLAEKLAIPLIHFLLLGFLPFQRMRSYRTEPAYAAGCGQLFFTTKAAYHKMGGHAAIKQSLHDGIKLPRAYRSAGLTTDLFDATSVAQCRMYHRGSEVWSGLAKNATEGLANPRLIVPATLLLLGGQVLPLVLVVILIVQGTTASVVAWVLTLLAVLLAYLPRAVGVVWFRQSIIGALLHPLGVVFVVAVQWYALFRKLLGGRASWKGRSYGG